MKNYLRSFLKAHVFMFSHVYSLSERKDVPV